MDGWSHPPEELEKSFSRTGAEVWDWHILGKNHLKEYPSVLRAQRDSREQDNSHWALHSWEFLISEFTSEEFHGLSCCQQDWPEPLGSVCLLKWEEGNFYSCYHCRCGESEMSLISPCTSSDAGVLSILVFISNTGSEFSCSRGLLLEI